MSGASLPEELSFGRQHGASRSPDDARPSGPCVGSGHQAVPEMDRPGLARERTDVLPCAGEDELVIEEECPALPRLVDETKRLKAARVQVPHRALTSSFAGRRARFLAAEGAGSEIIDGWPSHATIIERPANRRQVRRPSRSPVLG